MAKKDLNGKAPPVSEGKSARSLGCTSAAEIQRTEPFPTCCRSIGGAGSLEMTEQLNLLLADTMTLRDLYKKSHWQVAGPTFITPSFIRQAL